MPICFCLAKLIVISYIVKIILNPLLVVPASIVVTVLKNKEGIDPYDFSTNFNPFLIEKIQERIL
jgi:hypothetical protein